MITSRPAYHHGDLRNALVRAAVELAQEGGPQAIVLREAARRVGVSANAAYRHFTALPELIESVRAESHRALGAAMRARLDLLVPTDDPVGDAVARLHAVGRGYVQFALAEPGLFATAFMRQDAPHREPSVAKGPDTPWSLLAIALDQLVAVGALAPDDRTNAEIHAWSVVHGLSTLLLGPLADMPADEREPTIDATLELVVRGLRRR